MLGEIDRLRTHQKTLRERAKEKAEEAGEAIAVVLGGAAAGLSEAKITARPLGLSPNLIGGVALSVVGLVGWAGKHSGLITGLGTGILAYEAGVAVLKKMQQQAPATQGLVGSCREPLRPSGRQARDLQPGHEPGLGRALTLPARGLAPEPSDGARSR